MSGFNVKTFPNGKDAYEYICEYYMDIHVVISDMKMPKMNGIDLARAVKAFGLYRGSFLFITGGVNVSIDEYKDLVDGILPKPFDINTTISIINQWVKK